MSDERLQAIKDQIKAGGWVPSGRDAEGRTIYQKATPKGSIHSTLTEKPKKRLRQSQKPLMNKLEQEWFDRLLAGGAVKLRAQAVTFRLANGLRFTPDLTYWDPTKDKPCADEVKGRHAWDDSIAKLKMAASLYPEWRWRLVYKVEGQWRTETILP